MIPITNGGSSPVSFLTHPKLVLGLIGSSFVVFLYFFMGWVILSDVYQYPVVGAIYEILWLPMFASIAVIPALSCWALVKRASKRWWALVPIILIASVVVIIAYL